MQYNHCEAAHDVYVKATMAVLLSAGLLAGCSVKPELIGSDEMSAFVSSNAEQLFWTRSR